MQQSKLKELKENQEVKFIYKLPSSFYDEGFEYIIVGDIKLDENNITIYSLQQWFNLLGSGSLKGYVCSILPRKYKIKEYLNIYQKPNMLKLRRYILTIDNDKEIVQECRWGIQYIKEGKVNRADVFKSSYSVQDVRADFLELVAPIYKQKFYNG